MTARYAIYYAPAADTPIWAFGSAVLGYDAASGTELFGFALPGWDTDAWRAMTERPRTYGFHATLKAPFALASDPEDALHAAFAQFCRERAPFRLGPMGVTALMEPGAAEGFVALTPTAQPTALADLERTIVTHFDRFRRPLTEDERRKRCPERLSPRQRHQLDLHGYPFVFDDFRFHMTLTGATREAPQIADALADAMAARIGTVDLTMDQLCLFRQVQSGHPFRIVARHHLQG